MGTRSYQDALHLLNTLQTNAATLEALKKSGKLNQRSLPEMADYLRRLGYQTADLSRLSIIHVAGTKGKGSTCAFCSSILSRLEPSLKIGLYTSPHLQQVRERIKISGVSLKQEEFAHYFFQIWDKLDREKTHLEDCPPKPAYFRYLTLLAFHVFLQKKVDAVILEVGMGGQFDATNVINDPIVCGISSLGLDHTDVLGNTIDKIAWHKAGIIKRNVPVITVPQPDSAIKVIRERAHELGASGLIEINQKDIEKMHLIPLGIAGKFQKLNAALAKELCRKWVESGENKHIVWNEEEANIGLKMASWPGRAQTFKQGDITWYFDGAHTDESINLCVDWFKNSVNGKKRALIFNCTGGRNIDHLLQPLAELNSVLPFSVVIFTTNKSNDSNLVNNMVNSDPELSAQNIMAKTWSNIVTKSETTIPIVTESANDAISHVKDCDSVLVCGSLHLVGTVMSILKVPIT